MRQVAAIEHVVRAMIMERRRQITSVLSERPFKSADQKTERGKILNPEYSMDRDQPTSRASPLRINTLLSSVLFTGVDFVSVLKEPKVKSHQWSGKKNSCVNKRRIRPVHRQ